MMKSRNSTILLLRLSDTGSAHWGKPIHVWLKVFLDGMLLSYLLVMVFLSQPTPR